MTEDRKPADDRPLTGQKVLVTRPRSQAEELSVRLRALGATVAETPVIRIDDPPDPAPLREAARRLSEYDWVILTSVNGVWKLRDALEAEGLGTSPLRDARIAAIGPATSRALESLGCVPALVPDEFRAEALADAIQAAATRAREERRAAHRSGAPPSAPMRGQRALLPRAAVARDVLPERLRAAGAEVVEVPAYVTVVERKSRDPLRRLLSESAVDWITFTSSSTVQAFVELSGTDVGAARVAVIGPIAAATARSLGLTVDVVAAEFTVPGLVEALVSRVESAVGTGGARS
ncbi:MAG: uroporphyrinogen-III synthase [Gemmatimonadota bacterium]